MSGDPTGLSLPLITERLRIDAVVVDDAEFVQRLLNDEGFVRNIGDRGVRSLEQARRYIEDKFTGHYREHGFGMYAMRLRTDNRCVGTCGLVKRPALEDVDLGFALLPEFRRRGLAEEASQAVIRHARDDIRLPRLAAIVQPDNRPSVSLLRRLGFAQRGMIRLPGESIDLNLMQLQLSVTDS